MTLESKQESIKHPMSHEGKRGRWKLLIPKVLRSEPSYQQKLSAGCMRLKPGLKTGPRLSDAAIEPEQPWRLSCGFLNTLPYSQG